MVIAVMAAGLMAGKLALATALLADLSLPLALAAWLLGGNAGAALAAGIALHGTGRTARG